jgi:putative tryptophan/tyrosine transport system substrate-binding protein
MQSKFAKICIVLILLSITGAFSFAESDNADIVIVETMPVPVVIEHINWFQTGLADHGFIPGRNIKIEYIQMNGDLNVGIQRLREVKESTEPDLIVSFATLAAQAAVNVFNDTDIPILFGVVSDPVGAGIITEVGKPSTGNIAGRVYTLSRKAKIDVLRKLVDESNYFESILEKRGVIRLGIVHSSYPSSTGDLLLLVEEVSAIDEIEFLPVQIDYKEVPAGAPAMLIAAESAIVDLESSVDGWWEPTGPLSELPDYSDLIRRISHKPIIGANGFYSLEQGSLFCLVPDWEAGGRELADLAITILNGRNPGEIPVIPSESFKLGINLTVALDLGIIVPSDLLLLAGENIYYSSK